MRGQLNEFFTFINTLKAASGTALDVFFYDEKKKKTNWRGHVAADPDGSNGSFVNFFLRPKSAVIKQ